MRSRLCSEKGRPDDHRPPSRTTRARSACCGCSRSSGCRTRSSATSATRKTMLAPPELRAVHPLGKSPVVTRRRRSRSPSRARSSSTCVDALRRRAGSRRRPARAERLRYSYWLHYAEGSAMPPLLLKLVFDRIESAPMPFFVKPIARGIAEQGEARRSSSRNLEAPPRLHGERAGQRARGSPAASSARPTSR